ncbi:MAG: DnaD domain protein, partial [Clostridia bacterium]|nr:DnaD domain protein [Clostridia bacterium]
ATVKRLYEKGLVNLSSIVEYIKTIAVEDEFIRGVFEIVAMDRNPNEWDRKNLATWRDWGFSDEMISEAAKFAAGKSNPVVYINSVLSTWKSQGILSPDKIPSKKEIRSGAKTANDRTYTKEELDALIQDADKVEF